MERINIPGQHKSKPQEAQSTAEQCCSWKQYPLGTSPTEQLMHLRHLLLQQIHGVPCSKVQQRLRCTRQRDPQLCSSGAARGLYK